MHEVLHFISKNDNEKNNSKLQYLHTPYGQSAQGCTFHCETVGGEEVF